MRFPPSWDANSLRSARLKRRSEGSARRNPLNLDEPRALRDGLLGAMDDDDTERPCRSAGTGYESAPAASVHSGASSRSRPSNWRVAPAETCV